MPVHSAGLLLYRVTDAEPEVLIAHMGGPVLGREGRRRPGRSPRASTTPTPSPRWTQRCASSARSSALAPPEGPYAELGTWAYSSGKRITVFVADGADFSLDGLEFGEFELEWPPRSGRTQSFPEVDRAEWMPVPAAREKLVKGQRPALDALEEHLAEASR